MKAYRGLSPEQTYLLERRYCDIGHRFDGANFPTPEGECPACVNPDAVAMAFAYQSKVASLEVATREAGLGSPAYGTSIQEPPVALMHSAER